MRKKTHYQFIEELKLKNIHFQKKLFDVVSIYKRYHEHIKVKTIHGICEVKPSNLLMGKCPTITSAINKNEYFISQAKNVHGDTYIYEKVDYESKQKLVIITCETHGDFEQSPDSHLYGNGCAECGFENSGWSKSKWKDSAEKSNHFDSFKVYVIRCWNENEEFYKIGRTFYTMQGRYNCTDCNRMPYNYEIVKIIESEDPNYIYDLENRIKRRFHKNKYQPCINFAGQNECYKITTK